MAEEYCRLSDVDTPTQETALSKTIPGTTPFDGGMAQKGYALNKMCFSFNDKGNRDAFVADPEAYMKRYGLNEQQAEAIRGGATLVGGGEPREVLVR